MDELIKDIEDFLVTYNMPPTRFGVLALGDGMLMNNLMAGRELLPRTQKRIRDFMENYNENSE